MINLFSTNIAYASVGSIVGSVNKLIINPLILLLFALALAFFLFGVFEFIANQEFATLDLMPDAMVLVNFLKTLPIPTEILSSTGRQDSYESISEQKRIWLDTHGITFKQNFVPGKRFKYKFATPDSIIIDDTLSVIEDWRNAGGIAIWHHTIPETLSILKMYI